MKLYKTECQHDIESEVHFENTCVEDEIEAEDVETEANFVARETSEKHIVVKVEFYYEVKLAFIEERHGESKNDEE